MSKEKRIICPSCKGKGHVFDAASIFGFTIIVALFERNDANGLTRNVCGQCKGSGFI